MNALFKYGSTYYLFKKGIKTMRKRIDATIYFGESRRETTVFFFFFATNEEINDAIMTDALDMIEIEWHEVKTIF